MVQVRMLSEKLNDIISNHTTNILEYLKLNIFCAINTNWLIYVQLTALVHTARLLLHVSAITHGHFQGVHVTQRSYTVEI